MNESEMIVLGIVAVIVSAVSITTLRRHSFFGDGSSVVIGVCVGLLSALGIHQQVLSPARNVTIPNAPHPTLEMYLLPYTTLGITLILLLLVLLLMRVRRWLRGAKNRFTDRLKKKSRSPASDTINSHPDEYDVQPFSSELLDQYLTRLGTSSRHVEPHPASKSLYPVMPEQEDENSGESPCQNEDDIAPARKHGGLRR